MTPDCAIITPAPNAVFLRLTCPALEMSPAQAIRLADQLRDCARVALGVQDGAAVRLMLGGKR